MIGKWFVYCLIDYAVYKIVKRRVDRGAERKLASGARGTAFDPRGRRGKFSFVPERFPSCHLQGRHEHSNLLFLF